MVASVLCLLFMVGEVVGGVLSNSLAIATDAAHLLTDFASFMISLVAIWMAARPKSRKMSFGWHRAEVSQCSRMTIQCLLGVAKLQNVAMIVCIEPTTTQVLGAIVSVLLIWVVTGILVYMAVLR